MEQAQAVPTDRRAAALAMPEVQAFDTLPDSAHIDVKAVAAIRGNSVAQVWRDCKSGRMPAPTRFSPRCTRWKVGTLRAWLAAQTGERPVNEGKRKGSAK